MDNLVRGMLGMILSSGTGYRVQHRKETKKAGLSVLYVLARQNGPTHT